MVATKARLAKMWRAKVHSFSQKEQRLISARPKASININFYYLHVEHMDVKSSRVQAFFKTFMVVGVVGHLVH